MNPERWRELSPHLDRALDLEGEARAQYLATLRAADPALADDLAAMLADAAAVDEAGCGLGRVPIWGFHGGLDDVVPVRFSVNSIARLQQCTDPPPTDARLTVYADAGHDSWTRTYNLAAGYDIYDWMLGYKR